MQGRKEVHRFSPDGPLRQAARKESLFTQMEPSRDFVSLDPQFDQERIKEIRQSLTRVEPIPDHGEIFTDTPLNQKQEGRFTRGAAWVVDKLPSPLTQPYRITRTLRWIGDRVPLLEPRTEHLAKSFGTPVEKAQALQPLFDRQAAKGRLTEEEVSDYQEQIRAGKAEITSLIRDATVSSTANLALGKVAAVILGTYVSNQFDNPALTTAVVLSESFSGPPAVLWFIPRAFQEAILAGKEIAKEEGSRLKKTGKITKRAAYHLGVSLTPLIPVLAWFAPPLMTFPRQRELSWLFMRDTFEQGVEKIKRIAQKVGNEMSKTVFMI